ncbi:MULTISPECIES: hypothetical protein [Sphingomonadales]|uniref:hypothetical protein n=1 Tax=Sphingomonadales TaxID=204457 RepID=UPI0015764FD3|nr:MULTISPECIES: hypothetical protein [Sphingomonadales]MCC4258632.1 hypothetical protein [Sphingobium lactosutens]WQE10037.1 hypothetical protein U0025_25710 [Sphingobium yanoikuyae]HBN9924592.1 hypothetical protein [Pseudomonas aeruginosa]HBN9924779.1 hypothetical protein [Pseudomonas aeruginosa]|tara:strand:+ start:791 stop:1357 length:567 start_codon:yes stop_codon:yes gene_type:complete
MTGKRIAASSLAGANEPLTFEQNWQLRDRVTERVAHLTHRRQIEVERAARLLRLHFVNRRDRAPKRGTLHRLMLVGRYADTRRRDRDDFHRTDLEIWAFVDHDAYKGMNRYWGIARRAIASELRGRATVRLTHPVRNHAADRARNLCLQSGWRKELCRNCAEYEDVSLDSAMADAARDPAHRTRPRLL